LIAWHWPTQRINQGFGGVWKKASEKEEKMAKKHSPAFAHINKRAISLPIQRDERKLDITLVAHGLLAESWSWLCPCPFVPLNLVATCILDNPHSFVEQPQPLGGASVLIFGGEVPSPRDEEVSAGRGGQDAVDLSKQGGVLPVHVKAINQAVSLGRRISEASHHCKRRSKCIWHLNILELMSSEIKIKLKNPKASLKT
jgi:hypothetical protein